MRFNLFVVLPVAAGLCIVSHEVVHLLFFRGAFSEWAWHATGTALSLYALGLPGMASSTVIMRAIYARRMPRAAVLVTGVTVAVNLAASVALMRHFAYAGLAAASATAFTTASIFAAYKLSRNIGERLKIFELSWLWRVVLPLAAMSAALLAFKRFVPLSRRARPRHEGCVAIRRDRGRRRDIRGLHPRAALPRMAVDSRRVQKAGLTASFWCKISLRGLFAEGREICNWGRRL